MNKRAKICYLAAVFAVSANFAYAVDYLLEAGQSDTISTNVVYEKMDVYGDLSVYVPGGTKSAVKVVGFKTALNLIGGKLSLDSNGGSKYFRMGYGGANNGDKPTINLTNNAEGVYATIEVKDLNVTVDTGLNAEKLYLRKESEGTAPANGIIDFARLERGAFFVRQVFNETSCTGRLTVAGGGASYFCRRGRSSQSYFFDDGPFIVRIEDGSTWRCYFYNNRGDFNRTDAVVHSEGNGHVAFSQRPYGGYDSDTAVFRKGAFLNHNGNIVFRHDDDSHEAFFDFAASEIIGPNVTNVYNETAYAYPMRIRFLENVVQTLKNVSLRGGGVFVTGNAGSRLRISADDADRTVKVNIRSGDALVVEKIGAKEMVVSATTNFSHLVVSEGTVRITEDCVIEDLALAEDAELIADGCYVTVPDGVAFAGAVKTVNGGAVRRISGSQTSFYFAGGESVFARHEGYPHKYWRWTFTRVAGGVLPLHLCGFYLFAADGTVQSKSLDYANPATEMNYPALSQGYARWYHHSSTNLHCKVGEDDWRNVNELFKWFIDTFNGNNFPRLTAPLINPDDPASHLAVEMRLKDTAQPIVGYNMRRTDPNKSYPTDWKVEASDDGLHWEVIETREDVAAAPETQWYYTYDGDPYVVGSTTAQEHFSFAAYRKDGCLPMAEPISLQVDGGAVVDFSSFVGKQLVNALTVDCAAGTGEIIGAQIAESGILTITNADALSDGLTLPLTLPESIDGANLKNWTVVVDGKKGAFRVSLEADGTVKLLKVGMMLILR